MSAPHETTTLPARVALIRDSHRYSSPISALAAMNSYTSPAISRLSDIHVGMWLSSAP